MGPTHAASGDPSLGQDLEGRPRGSRMSSNARNETGVPSLERVFRGSFCRGVQKKKKKEKKGDVKIDRLISCGDHDRRAKNAKNGPCDSAPSGEGRGRMRSRRLRGTRE